MNIKKFMAIGLVGLLTCVGCGNAQEVSSENTEQVIPREIETPQPEEESTIVPEEPIIDSAQADQDVAKEQIQKLASLMGKTAEEVDAVLGEPTTVQNLEETDILLARYYKMDYLGEIVKIEVVFNDNEQVVNYVSFVLMKADDIEASKETLCNALTDLYGESTIERILHKKGKRNREWKDENLTYALTYYESNIALNIYPSDK